MDPLKNEIFNCNFIKLEIGSSNDNETIKQVNNAAFSNIIKEEQDSKEAIVTDSQDDDFRNTLIRQERTIQSISLELVHLERALHSAVSSKCDVFCRLEEMEGREELIRCKERQMDLDVEHLKDTIKNLNDDLNKIVTEQTAVRTNISLITNQFKIDATKKSEQLRIAKSNVDELRKAHQILQNENVDYASKLQEQSKSIDQILGAYADDLNGTDRLARMFEEKDAECEAHNNELSIGVDEMKEFLNESLEHYTTLQNDLHDSKLALQTELAANDEEIIKLKKELEDANAVLANGHKRLDEIDTDNTNQRWTYSELNSRYLRVIEQRESRVEKRKKLEVQMTKLLESIGVKAVEFATQQNELENRRTLYDQLVEKRNEMAALKSELERNRQRIDLLLGENRELKVFVDEFVKKFISTNQSNGELDAIESDKENQSDAIELDERSQMMVTIGHNLIRAIQTMEPYIAEIYHRNLPADNKTRARYETNLRSQKDNLMKIEQLTDDIRKIECRILELHKDKILLTTHNNRLKIECDVVKQDNELLNKQSSDHICTVGELEVVSNNLRVESGSVDMKLSTVDGRLLDSQNRLQVLENTKSALVIEVERRRQELAQAIALNKTLRNEVEMAKCVVDRKLIDTTMQRSEANHSRGILKKIFIHESVQTDFGNAIHQKIITDDISSHQFTKPCPNDVNSRKRKAAHPDASTTSSGWPKKLNPNENVPNKKAKLSATNNAIRDDTDLELFFSSRIQTRKQIKLLHDACNREHGQISSIDVVSVKGNEKQVATEIDTRKSAANHLNRTLRARRNEQSTATGDPNSKNVEKTTGAIRRSRRLLSQCRRINEP